VANYNVDIAVALKGAKQLTSFNREVKATSTNIDAFAKRLKSAAKDQTLLVRSFDNLNKVLSEATKNFNAAATGSQQQFAAARQLVSIEKELNKEYQERERVLQSITLKGQRSSILPGQSLFGQSVTPKGGASERSRQILAEEQALQEALARMDQRDMKLTGQSVNIEEKLKKDLATQNANRKKTEKEVAQIRERLIKKEEKLNATRRKILKEEITTRTRIFRQNQFGNVNPSMGGFRAFSQRADQITANAAATVSRPGIGSLIRNQFAPGGSFAATRGQRFRGAASNALIGGGFPLLFGQGPIGAIGGGLGGALGGALGGGFGFGLSIAGTAIAQQIQQTLDFRKSIRELNKEMERMGISSNISGSQVRQLGKALGITKEEAVKALQEFKRFGNDAVLIAKKFGGDFGKFDALTQANTVESALSAIRKINKDLTLEEELRLVLSIQRRGVEATINDVLTDTLDKQKQLDTEGFGQGVGGRKRAAVLQREQEQLKEINTENAELINKFTRIKILQDEIRIANEEASFSIQKGLQDVNSEIRRLNSAQFQVIEVSKVLGASFQESFKGIIRGTMSVGDAFRNMFMRIADHFLDMAAQMMAAQIRQGFLGLFSGMFGNNFTRSPVSATPALTPDQQVSRFTFMRANGGVVNAGKSYMVGERGAEMFVPNAGGRIVPNSDLGGSTNIVVNVDASGSSVEGDEEQGRELGRMISVAIQSELIKQKRPGGMLA